MFNNFFSENRAVYAMTWENTVEPDAPQITWRMRFACWIHETTNINSEYETFCFFTATVVARMSLNVTRTLPILFKLCFLSPARMQNLW